MNPFALTAEERAGAMMAPARTPDVGAFMDNLGALRAMLGPSVAQRMVENTEDQKAWLAAGNRGPRPLTEDRVWLADDVAGALLGPIGMAGVIKAYHGSPHRFSKFSMDKIGTGEGAQAYGHGLYFAESPDVAAGYQERLAMVDDGPPAFFRDASGNAIDEAPGSVWLLRGDDTRTSFEEMQKRAADKLQWAQGLKNKQLSGIETRKAQEAIDWLRDNPGANFAPNDVRGAFYTTRLDVEPEDLLDWDAPLSQQSEKVRAALEKANPVKIREGQAYIGDTLLGPADHGEEINFWNGILRSGAGNAYKQIERTAGKQEAARIFREAGIPGIKYLDQGSRASGEGTRNFVIFDDSLISIESID